MPMNPFQFIANLFINTMGITRPAPEAEKRATWYIVIMLTGVLVTVSILAAIAIHFASRR
jgi:heme/copper-type cytochrome/quinol oxidase subunit 3